jgi:hypothetical protein
VAFALAACSSDDGEQASTQAGAAEPATTVQESASETRDSEIGGSESGGVRVLIDGQPVEADLSRSHCEWGSKDGVEQLEFDAGSDDDGLLEVEIDMHNPPRLDDFEFDGPGDEDWEAEDHHKQSAQIGVEGDTYTVTSTVAEDDSDREAEMVAVFTCPRS